MGHHYNHIRVEGNTLFNNTVYGIDMPSNDGTTTGNKLRDNYISLNPLVVYPAIISTPDLPEWEIASNVWSGVKSLPLNDSVAGFTPASRALPGYPGVTVGFGTLFAWGDGCADALDAGVPGLLQECFKPLKGGPLDKSGAPMVDVGPFAGTDYFGKSRSATSPSIGFAE